jgi:hypothetical protein
MTYADSLLVLSGLFLLALAVLPLGPRMQPAAAPKDTH